MKTDVRKNFVNADQICSCQDSKQLSFTDSGHNRDVMGQQIANLVKVIGQKELIRRIGVAQRRLSLSHKGKCVQ